MEEDHRRKRAEGGIDHESGGFALDFDSRFDGG